MYITVFFVLEELCVIAFYIGVTVLGVPLGQIPGKRRGGCILHSNILITEWNIQHFAIIVTCLS